MVTSIAPNNSGPWLSRRSAKKVLVSCGTELQKGKRQGLFLSNLQYLQYINKIDENVKNNSF
jgi:hypothetical protein